MKRKILITGGLGYVGTELFNSIDRENNEVTIIDSNFNPFLVKDIIKKGGRFYQKDIFSIQRELNNCDICIHLAGITDVPQTVAKSNPIIDEEITKIGTEGTRFIIKHLNKNAKIFFASTQVVFDGLSESTLDINEEFKPCPSVSYSKSKRQSELDLLNSNLDFIIFRFASVYGYNDAVRWKILPNLFSKMTAQNLDLKVFGAENYKPLIGVKDLANFIIFLLNSKYNKEIFHCVNENLKVIDIANICIKYNNVNIIQTDELSPNNGFTLSNQKLLKTGFKFEQNLKEEIGKMINYWKNE